VHTGETRRAATAWAHYRLQAALRWIDDRLVEEPHREPVAWWTRSALRTEPRADRVPAGTGQAMVGRPAAERVDLVRPSPGR